MTNEQAVIFSLVNKQSYYKELVQPFIEAKKALVVNHVFYGDVEKEFKEKVLGTIADDITKNLAIPVEEVYLVLNHLNLEEYLKV